MKVYIDLVFLLNFLIDLNLLFIVNHVLKRHKKKKRIIASALFGNVTLIFLFFPVSSFFLFIIKILLCFFMSVIAFSYKNMKYTITNMIYIYMTSTIFGGALFLLKEQIKNNFTYILFLLLLIPLIAYEIKKIVAQSKTNYNCYYLIKIEFKNTSIELNSFLDTGNKLIDPYTHKGIILVNKDKIKNLVPIRSPIYVPFKSLNHTGLIPCIKPVRIEINGLSFKNYLIGLSDDPFLIDGIDCILNYKLMEDLHV